MSTEISSVLPQSKVFAPQKNPQETQKQAKIRELNDEIRKTEKQFHDLLKKNTPLLEEIYKEIIILTPLMDMHEESLLNQRIKFLKTRDTFLNCQRQELWKILASLYDQEAILTGNPSKSGRKFEEIKGIPS